MFNKNSGYVGYSRSVRSQNAIEDYEVPLSFINKSLVENFLSEYDELYMYIENYYMINS